MIAGMQGAEVQGAGVRGAYVRGAGMSTAWMPDAGPSMMRRRVVLPAVIALGSNQGDREQYLREAVRAIDALEGVGVTAASGIVESAALKITGVDESAPSYLNAVVTADSALDPEGLLAALHKIEARFGRVRTEVWGDRTLDLDLIDFGGLRRRNETITLPHPRAGERAFVLAPWLQVNPDAVLVAPADAAPEADGPGSVTEATPAGRTAAAAPAPASARRVADLLAAATDTVTDYPAEPLMAALDRTADR